ncbi:MAG: NTP transferase domain-containing protein [Candidatus Thorarchaeota archaeon]
MILAAGLGERMRPLTDDIPKALLKVGGKTLVDWAIKRLSESGSSKIVVAVGWKGSQIEDHLSSEKGVSVVRVTDYEIGPLQTFVTATESFNDDFLLIPVDIMIEPSILSGMVSRYNEQTRSNIMMLAVDDTSNYGTPVSIRNGLITGLGDGVVVTDIMSQSAMVLMGHSSIKKECKKALDAGETRLVSVLNEWAHEDRSLMAYPVGSPSLDIDTLSDLLKADRLLLERGEMTESDHIFVPPGDIVEVGNTLSLRSNISLHKGTEIVGPVLISPGCVVDEGCRIGPNVSLDSNSRLLNRCIISDSVVLGESTIQAQSRIQRAIVYKSIHYYMD